MPCQRERLAGAWPPEKKQRAVHTLNIKGVTRRGVWIRIYHTVFDVDTNLGPAFLYPPGADRAAKLNTQEREFYVGRTYGETA